MTLNPISNLEIFNNAIKNWNAGDRQGLRFLRAQLPDILATPPDVLSSRIIHIIEGLAEASAIASASPLVTMVDS